MPTNSSIILIANNESVAQSLTSKLILLRNADKVLITNYSEAPEKITKNQPEVVLLHCDSEKEDCLNLIKTIKENHKTASILLIVDNYEQDFILKAYDEEITDYLTTNADDAEILIRTIGCIKRNKINAKIQKQQSLLEEQSVLDKNTGFYSNKYTEKILNDEFESLKKENSDAILMLLAASEESKMELNPLDLAKAIKNSTRQTDIILHGNANRFYILFKDTPLKGVFCVHDKIKKEIGEKYSISASLCNVNEKTFEELKIELLKALVESITTKQDLIIASSEENTESGEDWFNQINSTKKNFKLFKQTFNKKLEKVITPVFYQFQKMYEEKLFKTQIEQHSNSALSSFILKKDAKISELKITYPGFSKINVDIVHQGLDSPENKRISLNLNELSESKLTKILEGFIAEFKTE